MFHLFDDITNKVIHNEALCVNSGKNIEKTRTFRK